MVADVLREAIDLIKAGKKARAREILEPFIIANPQNIQAWIWEIETRESDAENIKIMEACLLHNPDSGLIKKALAALKTRQEFQLPQVKNTSPFTSDSFLAETSGEKTQAFSGEKSPEKDVPCPHCGEMVKEGAGYCDSCGREITPTEVESVSSSEKISKPKKWYRRTWVKILLFLFLMPIWCVVELGDPDARTGAKVLAGMLLVFFINILCLFLYWYFTTNSSKANLLVWYRYLAGQTTQTLPDEIIRVDGSVQNPGTTPFSLVELQAKVYDKDGNLLGNNSQYLDSSELLPGAPLHFQMEVTSLLSSLNSGLTNEQLLFYDDFYDPSSGWNRSSSEDGETNYAESQFRILVNNANFDLWSNPGRIFSDVKIEVDASKLEGPEGNRFGVQCRYVDMDNYYFAVISSDGYYGIGKVVDGFQTFLPENGMLGTDRINGGSNWNHIRFDCVGTRLTLYINGDYVDAVDDIDLSDGDVGLLAGTFEETGTHISFDNFVVVYP